MHWTQWVLFAAVIWHTFNMGGKNVGADTTDGEMVALIVLFIMLVVIFVART